MAHRRQAVQHRVPTSPGPPSTSASAFNFGNTTASSFILDQLPQPSAVARGKRPAVSSSAHPSNTTANLSAEQVASLREQGAYSTLGLSPRRPSSGPRASIDGAGGHKGRRRSSNLRQSGISGHLGDESSFGMLEEDDEESRFETAATAAHQEAEDDEWTMVDRMRNWRNDAMTQHLYSTAVLWGSKVFGLTGNPNDAFWLAQTHFFTHQFAQAERILVALRPPHPSTYPAEDAPPRRLTDESLVCRYLAAQCQVRLGKWQDALEMVGKGGILGSLAESMPKGAGGIKLEASTSHLRGLIHLHQGATDLAKDAFMEALSRDVKCFESFEMLVGSEMMSSEEEWEFIQSLQYAAQTNDDADFVRMMYTIRLKKIKHRDEMTEARRRLTDDYGLGDDPDVMAGLADELYSSLRFAECYRVTSKILSAHSAHRTTLPLHLACMHHLPHLRSRLYLLAQELVDNEPDDAISWYAVGMWYFSGRRWEESRRYFGKSVLLDSRFGPSWIAFAHSYAYEGEHDQAITAYTTALRHFQGSHLPLLFIGMQYLGLANIQLASEYLAAARQGCDADPLVLNELGVVAHLDGRYEDAVDCFKATLKLSQAVQGSRTAWATTHLNLGHAYRKLGRLQDASISFRTVISLDPRSADAYAALGLVYHHQGNLQESISRYHEALSISPGDPVTCNLLKIALEDISTSISDGAAPFPGLPPKTLVAIDQLVAQLDAEILAGVPVPHQVVEENTTFGGEGEDETRADTTRADTTMEDETMDMSG